MITVECGVLLAPDRWLMRFAAVGTPCVRVASERLALHGTVGIQIMTKEECMKEFSALPKATSCRLIDFARCEIRPGFLPDTYILIVSGIQPYANMRVDLVPLIYIRQPEYWEIEVVGRLRGIGLPVLTPYTVSLPLDGVRGIHGVEVVGAKRREQLDVPPRTTKGDVSERVADYVMAQP
jgi:hypothetical protein